MCRFIESRSASFLNDLNWFFYSYHYVSDGRTGIFTLQLWSNLDCASSWETTLSNSVAIPNLPMTMILSSSMFMEYTRLHSTFVIVQMRLPTTDNFSADGCFQQLQLTRGLLQHSQYSNIFTSYRLSPKSLLTNFTIPLHAEVITQA